MERKMLFVALEYPDDINVAGRLFWYGCRDGSVTVGDSVSAPLGRHDRLQTAIVRKTVWATEEDAPYPLHLIKYVKCKLKKEEE